ncbi:Nuclease (SNase domain protein) [Candidatus Accumulibacter aalborgensis]|uniref:Nuclease (SNase domain protein) n=1 Tax=Candidatus Accumulibacter aalborgensis TaxID=1860102 RepID=A0A1A8XUK4_9PROT|nr:thermonuclease family protein [Candidatus Accumulibacter aalborgensis]SBT07618.1 Nuclease (SNase domain protein) [Candidatus Accumulibacter aalborgensis]
MLSLPSKATELQGYVIGITDGDTLTLLVDQQPHTVRVIGIDAPERHQPFGERSKQNLAKLAFNKSAIADCPKKDRYQRDLCKVMVDGQDVGLKQVSDGMAWWYRRYAHEQSLADRVAYEQAEVLARNRRVGLWVDGDAVPPWEWRKQAHLL